MGKALISPAIAIEAEIEAPLETTRTASSAGGVKKIFSQCALHISKVVLGPVLVQKTLVECPKESIPVYYLNKRMTTVDLDRTSSLPELIETVQLTAGLSPEQQTLAVQEERGLTLNTAYQRMKVSIICSRSGMRQKVLRSVSFLALPEFFNREVRGRGIVSWIQASDWFQGLLEARSAGQVSIQSERNLVRVLIGHLDGEVRLIEVEETCSLVELKEAIQEEFGIPKTQQRILVKERPLPGPFTRASQHVALFLHSCLKIVMRKVVETGVYIINGPQQDFTGEVYTTMGKKFAVVMNGTMTIDQVRKRAEKMDKQDRIVKITLPPQLPVQEERRSRIISNILV